MLTILLYLWVLRPILSRLEQVQLPLQPGGVGQGTESPTHSCTCEYVFKIFVHLLSNVDVLESNHGGTFCMVFD